MKKHLIFTILFLSATTVQAEISGVNCPEYQTLFPIEEFISSSEGLEVEADQSEINQNNDYILTGNVTVKSNAHFLSADEISISKSDQSTLAKGNAKFQDERFLITGNQLFAKKQNDDLLVKLSNARYQQIDSNANGTAETVSKTTNSVVFENATYSLCPLNQNDWLIQADSIELDFETNRGLADDAVIKFYDYPVFYYPLYQWVLEGRGTGFLTPEFERYSEAGDVKTHNRFRVPYYFNLAPDRDLLFAYSRMSNRGSIYEGTYRQLLSQSQDIDQNILIIDGKYLSQDHISKTKRWLFNTSLELDINEKIHLSLLTNRVSDKDYFKDIAHSNTSEKKLNSHIKVSFDDPKRYLTAHLLSEDEQIINAGTPDYTKDFEVSVSKTINPDSDYPLQTNLVTTKFTHDTSSVQSGLRTHGGLSVSRTLNFKFPKVTTRADVGVTHYLLNNSNNITRTTAGFGVGLAFPFTSQTQLLSNDVIHQFTPRISYNYRAKQVQGNIPIFDTTDKHDDIITFADLTSGERYTGFDRVTNANDITLSLESDLSDKGSNKSLVNMKLAQSFYADDEVVSDKENTDYELRKTHSDIAASIDLSLGNFIYNTAIQFDPDKATIVKRNNTLSYKLNPKKFVSISTEDDGSKKTLKLYGAYPVTNSIHLFAGIDKTTSTGITNSETTGVVYESCCWAFRLAHFKESSGSGYDYSTGAELVFKGLGSSSFSLRRRIEEKIPYYRAGLTR
jgi:LPS-assembly protein